MSFDILEFEFPAVRVYTLFIFVEAVILAALDT